MVLLFSRLWVAHLEGTGFDFIVFVPLLPSCFNFFVFEHVVFLFGDSRILLSVVVQQLVVILVLLQEEMSIRPSALPS